MCFILSILSIHVNSLSRDPTRSLNARGTVRAASNRNYIKHLRRLRGRFRRPNDKFDLLNGLYY